MATNLVFIVLAVAMVASLGKGLILKARGPRSGIIVDATIVITFGLALCTMIVGSEIGWLDRTQHFLGQIQTFPNNADTQDLRARFFSDFGTQLADHRGELLLKALALVLMSMAVCYRLQRYWQAYRTTGQASVGV